MTWGSKWLEREAHCGQANETEISDARAQPGCTSGRQHGTRWFNVVQGIRRSLDVHLKNYNKVDAAFTSSLRSASASGKLQALSRGLTDTNLVDFCCVYLVHPGFGTFGIVALSGAGSELYPAMLTEVSSSTSSLNVFTRCVFQVEASNWAVEDVVDSKAPWYYDCASAVNGFGLPQDGAWLRRVGMRSVLALPCMLGSEVTGVVAVASKQKTLDHLLLRKLEELVYKVTPTVADAVSEHSLLLGNRRAAGPYESICDFAHEVLDEMLNLDRAVAASVSGPGNGSSGRHPKSSPPDLNAGCIAAAVAAAATPVTDGVSIVQTFHNSQQQQPCSSGRARRAHEGYEPAAAAAAAAAGFSWTLPSAPTSTATPQASAQQLPSDGPLPSTSASQEQQMGLAQSLPTRAAAGQVADSLLRTCEPPASFPPSRQQRLKQQSAECASRSTRSLSCLEFSDGPPCEDVREGLVCDSSSGNAFAAVAAAAVATGACSQRAAPAPAWIVSQQRQQQQPCRLASAATAAVAAARTPGSLSPFTESGTGHGFMLDSLATAELTQAVSPSAPGSYDRQAFHRVSPLESGLGATIGSAPRAIPPTSRLLDTASFAATPLPVVQAATNGSTTTPSALTAARCSSTCATETSCCASAMNTTITSNATNLAGALSSAGASIHTDCLSHRHKAGAPERFIEAEGGEVVASVDAQEGILGRWSRESATAAAAMWGNEAAEAFAAALQYTASHADCVTRTAPTSGNISTRRLGLVQCSSASWTAPSPYRADAAADAATAAKVVPGEVDIASRRAAAAAASLGVGSLYGICESGPAPSLELDLDTSSNIVNGGYGMSVMDPASGAGFFVSSGLGMEAQQRRQQYLQHASASVSRGSSSQSQSRPSSERIVMVSEQQWLRCGAVQS